MNHNEFLSKDKSLLIAPAGYGKTHTIAECLKYSKGKHLVLTHTHAGVASLKEKLKKEKIASDKYQIETIVSFCQKYHSSFYTKKDTPEQEDSSYYSFIVNSATNICKIPAIQKIITSTYAGLFVDEYQDCTANQHELINILAKFLPTHILGDPLQGIFNFNGDKLVDWDKDLEDYKSSEFTLDEPWRWKKTNPSLGKALQKIRADLISKVQINLDQYTGAIEFHKFPQNDLFNPRSEYSKLLRDILTTDSNVLLIYPDSSNINGRLALVKNFGRKFYLVESVDSKIFYEFSKKFDNTKGDELYSTLKDFLSEVCNKAGVNLWYGELSIKKKKDPEDSKQAQKLKNAINDLKVDKNFNILKQVLLSTLSLAGIKLCRDELFNEMIKAISFATINQTSIYDAMCRIRNRRRIQGRAIQGKAIGTTLLTKGLEFDTVIVLDAQRFTDEKNFYVAITRASIRLVIIANSNIVNPYTVIS